MQSLDLQPTKDNLEKTLKVDAIGRNKDIAIFVNLLCNIKAPFSVAINGNWGSGKTFFIKQTSMVLDLLSKNNSELNIEDIPNMQSLQKKKNEFSSIYYDAWKNDNDCDPILSILFTICHEYKKQSPRNRDIKKGVMNIVSEVADLTVGKYVDVNDIKEIEENVEKDIIGKKIIDPIEKQKKLFNKIKNFFNNLLGKKDEKLIVFIDELDRCKPSYAINLMERIKHYFSDSRIIFVFSVNIDQLKHMIQKSYGVGFDGEAYLDRFFNLNLSLPKPKMDAVYSLMKIKDEDINPWIAESSQRLIRHFDFSLREITRFYLQVKVGMDGYFSQSDHIYFPEENARLFSFIVFVPYLIGLRMRDINKYNKFVAGKECKDWISYTSNFDRVYEWLPILNRDEETFDSNEKNKKIFDKEEKLRKIYLTIFYSEGKESEFSTGQMHFSSRQRSEIIHTASLLSDWIKLE